MSDIALSKNSMMFVTPDGEGFSGTWAGEYKKYEEKKGEKCRDVIWWAAVALTRQSSVVV